MKRVALLTGGPGKEREISLKSAKTVKEHIPTEKYIVDQYILPEDMENFLDQYVQYDIAIPLLHGDWGEDGKIAALLDTLDIPYIFSSHATHSLSLNKYVSNLIVEELGFHVPQSLLIHTKEDIDTAGFPFAGKIFVKPNKGGSSVDSGVFDSLQDAQDIITTILEYDDVLVQEIIKGREFTVSVLGDYNKNPKVLGITEIVTKRDFFDFKAKYELDQTEEILPARIDQSLQEELETIALHIYKKFKISTLGRIDFLYQDGKFYFLEVNTIPGMTATSFFPQAVIYSGYLSLGTFFDEILSGIEHSN